MRLLTHNYLQSTVKGTTNGYPLMIRPTVVIIEEASEVDVEMIRRIISKIDYSVLKEAYLQIYDVAAVAASNNSIHLPPTLPDEIPNELLALSANYSDKNIDEANDSNNDHDTSNDSDQIGNTTTNDDEDAATGTFYKTLFCALFEIHIMEGTLICPDTKREFPIKDGIPNMILHEDEL